MQKWEYLYVSDGILADGREYRTQNGRPLTLPSGLNIYQYFNQLGSKGWELVGIGIRNQYAQDTYSGTTYVFKRPEP